MIMLKLTISVCLFIHSFIYLQFWQRFFYKQNVALNWYAISSETKYKLSLEI